MLPMTPVLSIRPILLGFAVLLLGGCTTDDAERVSTPAVLVVQPSPAAEQISGYPGQVRARREVPLAFRIGGKVAQRHFDIGERVKAGQIVATLDATDVSLGAESAAAGVAAAKADRDLAEAERSRFATLRQRGLVSATAADQADRAAKAATAQLRQATAQASGARNQREYATLRATEDGVITERRAEPGQVVGAGEPIYLMAADGPRDVAIALPESAIRQFDVGQPVVVTLWSEPDRRLPATVRELSPAADPVTRTFAARVAFAGDAGDVELGQSARVFVGGVATDFLAVPLPAVSAEGAEPFVYVVTPDRSTVERRPITVAAFAEDVATVRTGLSAEDWVVAAGAAQLHPGMAVIAVDRDNRPVLDRAN